ncbi:MAG: SH3 domain-containing protein [Dehalobacterium sp.]
MTKGRLALLVVAAIVFLSVGFVIGQIVQAAGTVPGTAGNPLVSQSYVEKVVGETVAELENKLDEMESKVTALQEKIDDLSSSSGKGSSSVSSGNSKSNSGNSSSGSSTNKPDTSSQGKTVVVSSASANVRTGPGTTYEKITTLLEGDTVKLILEENSWCKVTLDDGQEGWIANWLVKVE